MNTTTAATALHGPARRTARRPIAAGFLAILALSGIGAAVVGADWSDSVFFSTQTGSSAVHAPATGLAGE